MSKEFISLPPKPGSKRIGQGVLPFAVEKQGDSFPYGVRT